MYCTKFFLVPSAFLSFSIYSKYSSTLGCKVFGLTLLLFLLIVEKVNVSSWEICLTFL